MSHYKQVIVITNSNEIFTFPEVHISARLSEVADMLRVRLDIHALCSVFFGYREDNGQIRILSSSISVQDAANLIIQVCFFICFVE